jgi:hypothetical protein
MRLAPGGAVAALCTLAIAGGGGEALALAGVPGGSRAPSSPEAGGVEFGFPARVALPHPAITALSSPTTMTAGAPPKVTVRIDERGVGTVEVEVVVRDVTTRHAALVARMGWSHTGRTLLVQWPAGASIAPGSYELTVSAHDHRGTPLVRRAHSSGRAVLRVRAAPKPAPAPVPPPAPGPTPPATPPAGVPTPSETLTDGSAFPVAGAHSFGDSENRFGAPRGGHVHEGQDVLTAEGTPVLAPIAGTIESTSYQAGGAGYYVVEHTSVGFDFFFAHCQLGTFAVAAAQAVAVGQAVCHAGQTGDATAPHLHFEMWVGGWQSATGRPIDPLPYLEAWERAGA